MKRKRGFTLVEILIVTSVVAICLAIIFPAIQQSREDARSRTCKNRLKMFGLALHNYHDVYGCFPPGWVSAGGAPGLGARFGWQTSILPFFDQAPLFNRVDFQQTPAEANGQPRALYQIKIADYRCPADPAPDLNSLRGEYATSNYSGNYGPFAMPRLTALGVADVWPGAVDAPMQSAGIFARNSSVRIASIVDGTSNTLMVAERGFSSGASIWVGVTDNAHEDDTVTDCSHRSRPNAGWSSYSSRHKGGLQALLCDGSVRFLTDKIDSMPAPEMGVYQRLAHKSDGQVIGDF
jgi:prepilin-type N-terminal cleavage/methylation domain-containing protein/prepilin-type processing-associated H-X9-DG protein